MILFAPLSPRKKAYLMRTRRGYLSFCIGSYLLFCLQDRGLPKEMVRVSSGAHHTGIPQKINHVFRYNVNEGLISGYIVEKT